MKTYMIHTATGPITFLTLDELEIIYAGVGTMLDQRSSDKHIPMYTNVLKKLVAVEPDLLVNEEDIQS